MASSTALKTLSLAVPLAGVLTTPDEASACGATDGCSYMDSWTELAPLNATVAIPIDGVLLLQGTQNGLLSDAEWLAKIDLTVTRDGQPIAGALETSSVDNVLIWRPAAELEPGATYKVAGILDNPEESYEYGCGPDLMLDFEFSADMGLATPLAVPSIDAAEKVQLSEGRGLDDLVCCDDAFPYEYVFDCSGDGTYVGWSEGFCTPMRGTGALVVELSFNHGLPASTATLVTRQVLIDGEPGVPRLDDTATAVGDKPFCTEVVLHNLATGETVTSAKQCHGDALVDQLGPQMLDPSGQLADNCSGPAYVCEQAEGSGSWDMNKCTPWPPESPTTGETEPTGGPQTTGDETGAVTATDDGTGDTATEDDLGDRGCSCNGGAPGGLGVLAIAGLALLRRRRVSCPV